MFGGGAKKEKKDDDEDRGDNSGSAKAQRDAAAAKKEGDDVSAGFCPMDGCNTLHPMQCHRALLIKKSDANRASTVGRGARVRGRPL